MKDKKKVDSKTVDIKEITEKKKSTFSKKKKLKNKF